MLRVNNVKVSIDNRGDVKAALCKKLRVKEEQIIDYKIHKESLDVRRNKESFVYSIDVNLQNEGLIIKKNIKDVSNPKNNNYIIKKVSKEPKNRPIVIGSGPCGLFASYVLAKAGLNPILIERGADVDERTKAVKEYWLNGNLNINTNVQFGEGGAGTFSDGKLTTNIKDSRCRFVLETLVEFGSPKTIMYSYRPHVGTDILREVVKNIRKEIIRQGGDVYFNTLVSDIIIENNRVVGVITNQGKFKSDSVVLAIGHSARDTYKMLYNKNMKMESKSFSIGLRVEHPQKMINVSQFGKYAGNKNLGPADYRLKYHDENGRSAYSFCMCPGGVVVASSSDYNEVVTNGMSYNARDKENANSAILVGVSPKDYDSDHPLAGIEFQKKYEQLAFNLGGSNYYAPVQLLGDFLNNEESQEIRSVKPSYKPGVKLTNLNTCLPSYVTDTLKRAIKFWGFKIKGFDFPEAILTGVETRSSAPLRINRNEELQSNIVGVYPAGEGAGFAGGIISAAVDGIRVAEKIVEKNN